MTDFILSIAMLVATASVDYAVFETPSVSGSTLEIKCADHRPTLGITFDYNPHLLTDIYVLANGQKYHFTDDNFDLIDSGLFQNLSMLDNITVRILLEQGNGGTYYNLDFNTNDMYNAGLHCLK